MKKVILLLFSMVLATTVKAEGLMLQIWQTDGQVVTIALSEEPVTTYADGKLVVKTKKTTLTYPLEKIKKYTYATYTDGISLPGAVKAEFSNNGETLTFTGLKPNTNIWVYTAAGQVARKLNSGKNSKVVVSVSDFPSGVYVVKANDVTYKITKK